MNPDEWCFMYGGVDGVDGVDEVDEFREFIYFPFPIFHVPGSEMPLVPG